MSNNRMTEHKLHEDGREKRTLTQIMAANAAEKRNANEKGSVLLTFRKTIAKC